MALEVRRAYLAYQAAREQLTAAQAQQRAADLAASASQERYRVGAATFVEPAPPARTREPVRPAPAARIP